MIANNRVKVWNRNIYPFSQVFKGDKIFIEPGKFIEMDYDEAVLFKSSATPIVRDTSGQDDPRFFKMIEIDPEDVKRIYDFRSNNANTDPSIMKYVCHMCTKEFVTKKGLLKHIKTNHLDAMGDEDARDDLIDDEAI